MKYDKFVRYLNFRVLSEINTNCRYHKGKPDYEPIWTELKKQCKAAIKILSKEGDK